MDYRDYKAMNKDTQGNGVLPCVSNRLFRIFYTVFLTAIYFGLQLLMMKFNLWVMISINTVLMAVAADSIAKHYRKWKNGC